MISAVIFSKNRALQLDLLLKSIYKNFSQCNQIKVIWKTNEEHKISYDILNKEHCSKVYSIQQNSNFYEDVYNACKSCKNSHIVFFTDDDIVYRPIDIDTNILNTINDKFCCYSLRLGLNTNKRQVENNWYTDFPNNIHQFTSNTICWNRTSMPIGSYWAYPLSVDGHIFHKTIITNILYEIFTWSNLHKYTQTPNKLEGLMQRFFFEIGPLMIANNHSSVVNSPNNRVQSEYVNRSGDIHSYCEDFLNQIYLNGTRININNLDFSNICCPHTELDILK